MSELKFISDVQVGATKRQKGDVLVRKGNAVSEVHILLSGWASMTSQSKSMGNRIIQVYLPGNTIGFAEIGSQYATHQVRMQTDGTVSSVSRKTFCRLLRRHRRLEALLLALGSLDLVAQRYQLSCMNSMTASQNLKHFLLQLRARQCVSGAGEGDRFEVPFSQVEIGQAVGMTSIYVNKLLRSFKETGDLEISRPYFRLLHRENWEADTEYIDAYKDLDTSWFPRVEDEQQGLSIGRADPQRQHDRSSPDQVNSINEKLTYGDPDVQVYLP